MSEGDESGGTVIELLLREPEIVALARDRDVAPRTTRDYEPPRAA